MAVDPSTLRVDIGLGADADALELDEETRRLRDELLQLDLDSVERPPAPAAPEGTRSAELAIFGTLLVQLGHGTIEAAVRSIQNWVGRRRNRTAKLTLNGDTIELSDPTDAQQGQLLQAFLGRHTSSAS